MEFNSVFKGLIGVSDTGQWFVSLPGPVGYEAGLVSEAAWTRWQKVAGLCRGLHPDYPVIQHVDQTLY